MKRTKHHSKRSLLDGLGTSQKQQELPGSFRPDVPSPESLNTEFKTLSEQAKQKHCINNAPMICIPPKEKQPAKLFQGTCNSWTCPRCGLLRASQEYARICEGLKNLQKRGFKLFFMTITPKGTETAHESESSYLLTTNRLLSVLRASAKRTDQHWTYVQVTERQKRGNPHSHFITSYIPPDAFFITQNYPRYVKEVARLNRWLPIEMRFSPRKPYKIGEDEMFSRWLCMKCVRAGLGVQCNIQQVRSARGAANYMAKYMFKAAQDTQWPKGWKRVRYAQNWDKLPESEDCGAFVVMSREDWTRVAQFKHIETSDPIAYEIALVRGLYQIVCTVPNHIDFSPELYE